MHVVFGSEAEMTQVIIRMSDDLRAKLERIAQENDRSLSYVVRQMLQYGTKPDRKSWQRETGAIDA